MRKLLFLPAILFVVAAASSSCSDTETYADLVNAENGYIDKYKDFINMDCEDLSEDDISAFTAAVLDDSIHPEFFLKLNRWYRVTEGNFKKLYFRINSWGNDAGGYTPSKFRTGSNVLVRYDSTYILNSFKNYKESTKYDNMDPNSYQIVYAWSSSYYATTYYASYNSTGSSYECTSGGLGFPVRFLWSGGNVSLIVPFSLGTTADKNYYYTTYYGSVTYTKPNYLPE